jgi:hypothetical protein
LSKGGAGKINGLVPGAEFIDDYIGMESNKTIVVPAEECVPKKLHS